MVGALVAKFHVRQEAKLERMVAKVAAEAAATAAANTADQSDDVIDVTHKTIDVDPGSDRPSGAATEPQTGGTAPAGANTPTPDPPKKIKNHGRNGAAAYTNAKHVVHALVPGVLGSLCECGKACMTKYREKVTIRVLGQPLFGGELHHFEQARCRMCGKISRAAGPAAVMDGIGSSYS